MASSLDLINFICEQIESCGMVSYKKMFGEYMIYINAKPIILVCDDTAFVKINEVTNNIVPKNEIGEPYKGAKPHYILDVDDKELLCEIVTELEKVTPLPKPKKRREKMSDLLENINKIHTTTLGAERISRNLDLPISDIVEWCKNAVKRAELIMKFGKNLYVYVDGFSITINAKSFTIITAHKICGKARVMEQADYPCLEEFLYQAIFIKKGEPLPLREIIKKPEIYIYIKDFGTQIGDLGVVAEQDGQVIGAAWTRIIPAYGHIDDFMPELAISILPEFRGCGIGTKLMKKLFVLLKNNGYKNTSLSVQKQNPALKFYKRLGYKIVNEKLDSCDHEDYLMVKDL